MNADYTPGNEQITHSIGWEWTFYLVAIFSGVLLPVVVLFVPETAFRREAYLDTDTATTEDRHYNSAGLELSRDRNSPETEAVMSSPHSYNSSIDKPGGSSDVRHLKERNGAAMPPAKASFAHSLLPFNGRKTDEAYWKLLLRPFPLFLHPAILWVRKHTLMFPTSSLLPIQTGKEKTSPSILEPQLIHASPT